MTKSCKVPCRSWWVVLVALQCTGCATRWDATKARFVEPHYVITRHFYDEAPQRVAVLPFATRSGEAIDERKAEVCRRIFYQHMCLRDYEDIELRRFDASLHAGATNRESMIHQLVDVIRLLDVVGMTTVLDLRSMFGTEPLRYSDFMEMIRMTHEDMHADAYVVGITRDYGRFYAVLLSSVGISTRMEMRSASTGNLLWRSEDAKRNYEIPLTLNPFDVPRLLYDVWRNSRGLAMDALAYEVFGDLAYTLPYVPGRRGLFVEFERPYTPYFREPTLWLMFPRGRAAAGQRFPFHLEQNGWYQCKGPEGDLVWVFRKHGRLVDAEGRRVDPRDDLRW